ncbi:MAG: lipid A deacylase LpxR family protein [Rhodobacteraceae bacterium]|nr:lipid A deacylase LpxR family protein [Paracoccaceae bacterium]
MFQNDKAARLDALAQGSTGGALANIVAGVALGAAAMGPIAAMAQQTSEQAVQSAFAEDRDGVLSLINENDELGDAKDRWRTSGIGASYLFPSDMTPWLNDGLANSLFGDAPRRFELSGGQIIATPEALSSELPVADDRAYGAFLYVGAAATSLDADGGLLGFRALTEDHFGVQAGIVGGDAALGEFVQDLTHRVLDGADPNGWGNGLENEFGVNLTARRVYHVYGDLGFGDLQVEWRPSLEASLGTVSTYAAIGTELRIGDDLVFDLTRADNRAGVSGGGYFGGPSDWDGLSWALFVGAQGRAVGYDVFLDGNVFANGPDDDVEINKNDFTLDLNAGFSVAVENFRLGYVYTWRSEEFDEQDEAQAFGRVTVSVKF